jgi:hypothetical protein
MDIENILSIDVCVERQKLLVKIKVAPLEITELRVLHAINQIRNLLDELKNDKVKQFYFVFDVDELKIPANFQMFKNIGKTFVEYEKLILEKLDFSVIQCTNNIFKMFFGLFKKYYIPIKPLYMCSTKEDTWCCIHDVGKRDTYPNICNMIKG